jgi:hypothetical protein
VPTTAAIHRFPVDNWRFLPDCAYALQQWAKRQGNGVEVLLTELFRYDGKALETVMDDEIVMIFRKEGGTQIDATQAMVAFRNNLLWNSLRHRDLLVALRDDVAPPTRVKTSVGERSDNVAAISFSDVMLAEELAHSISHPCCRSPELSYMSTTYAQDQPTYSVSWFLQVVDQCRCEIILLVPKVAAGNRADISQRYGIQ